MTYLAALAILSLLVAVHELGHLLAGKWMNVPIARFSVGFGRKLAGFTYGGTEYRLSAIPLGGYVMPAIEEEEEYFRLSARQRIIFALGGPLANILFALPAIALINALSGPATIYDLTLGPVIQAMVILKAVLLAIPAIFSQPENVSSVVGIVSVGGQFAASGIIGALKFAVIISLNLAIFNMLPLPPLDGGKIVLDVLEAQSPKLAKGYVPACMIGWIALIGLMIYATAQDIIRLSA